MGHLRPVSSSTTREELQAAEHAADLAAWGDDPITGFPIAEPADLNVARLVQRACLCAVNSQEEVARLAYAGMGWELGGGARRA